MMKLSNKLVGSALLVLLSNNAMAESGDYVNAQLAIADVDGFSDGLAVVASYGIPMRDVHKNFSVEGEFTFTLIDPDRPGIEVSYFTLAGYGVYTHPVDDNFKLRGRLGLLYEDVDVTLPGTGISASDGDIGLSFGFGVTYKLDKQMNLIAEYTIIESDISHLSAGIQYRF